MLAYGSFITAVIEFLVIAWAVFLLVKLVNRIKQATEQKAQEEATRRKAGRPQREGHPDRDPGRPADRPRLDLSRQGGGHGRISRSASGSTFWAPMSSG